MPVRCMVENCGNKAENTTMMESPRIYYHSLGAIKRKNPERFDDFLRIIGYKGNRNHLQYQHICCLHFAEDAYKPFELARVISLHPSMNSHRMHRGPLLRDEAWPTLNLPRISAVNRCSLDKNQVQCYLSFVHDHSRLVNRATSHQLAQVETNIYTAVKQDSCTSGGVVPFEHIKIETILGDNVEDGSHLEPMEEIPEQSGCNIEGGIQSQQYHIKSEPMEDVVPSHHFGNTERVKDEIPSHLINVELMEDRISPHHLGNTECVEVGIPSQHLGNVESMEARFPSHHLGNVEDVEGGIPSQHLGNAESIEAGIPSHHLGNTEHVEAGISYVHPGNTECVEDSIPLRDTEFLDVSTVLYSESDSKNRSNALTKTDPLYVGDSLVHFAMNELTSKTHTKSDFFTSCSVISSDNEKPKVVKCPKKNKSLKNVKETTQVVPKQSPILLKRSNETYMCLICLKDKKTEVKLLNIDEFHDHLDTHIDTSFKQCSNCSEKFISINEYYAHVKMCNSDEIDFSGFVQEEKRVNYSNTESWTNSCIHADCNAKLPNYCSKLLHENYSTHTNCDVDYRTNLLLLATKQLKCLICNVAFKDENLYHAHCNSSILFPETLNYCTFCKCCFETSQDYTKHERKEHARKPSHFTTCKLCSKLHRVGNSVRHKTFEHNTRMVYCFVCSKTVYLHKFKQWHMPRCITHNTDPHICAVCSKMFQSLSELYAHFNVEELDLDYPQYQCRNCYNYFCSKFNLSCHMLQSKCGN